MLSLIARLALPFAVLIAGEAPQSPTHAGPDHYKVGAYVTAIHDLNVAAGTFSADLWIWTVGTSPARDPLRTMEFVNADQVTKGLEYLTERAGLSWRQHKISGRFRHDWVLRNYPFDRQTLKIVLEEGTEDAASIVYDPDTSNTGYQAGDDVEGWRIIGITMESGLAHYASTFGDPASAGQGGEYARTPSPKKGDQQPGEDRQGVSMTGVVALQVSGYAPPGRNTGCSKNDARYRITKREHEQGENGCGLRLDPQDHICSDSGPSYLQIVNWAPMSPEYVQPYVKAHKNDERDAEAMPRQREERPAQGTQGALPLSTSLGTRPHGSVSATCRHVCLPTLGGAPGFQAGPHCLDGPSCWHAIASPYRCPFCKRLPGFLFDIG